MDIYRCTGERNVPKGFKLVGLIVIVAALCFLFGFVIMLLWNWLMPMIFGLTTLTYLQSVGVMILASILFGRFGGRSRERRKSRHSSFKDSIRDSVKEEIKKDFEKEYGKNKNNHSNESYDEMYDKWWEQEGESLFEEYMKSNKDS